MWKTLISSFNSPYIFIVSELDYVCYCKYLQCLHEADEPLPGSKSASAIEAHAKNPTGSLWILDQHEPAFIHFFKVDAVKTLFKWNVTFSPQLDLVEKNQPCIFSIGKRASCRIYASCRHEKWMAFSCPLPCWHQGIYFSCWRPDNMHNRQSNIICK